MTTILTSEPKRPKVARALRAFAQLGLLALGIFLATFWVIARKAEAKLVDAAEQIVPALASELRSSQAPRAPFEGTLYLNGLPLHIESRSLPGTPPEQISPIQKGCRGFSFEAKETTGLGRTVVCLRAPRDKSSELTAGIQRFAATSNLAELGSPEVHFLRGTEQEGEAVTQLLQVRAPSLDLHSAFPSLGDAPGLDPTFAPRPVGRRILSVQFQESPQVAERRAPSVREILFAYESAAAPEDALRNYEHTLLQKGLFPLPTGNVGPLARAFESNDSAFLVMTGSEGRGSWLSLALLPKTGPGK